MGDTGAGADEEATARRQARLEQRHLEAYRNLHRLRDALYQRYAALLKDKVQAQRLQLQQRHEATLTKTQSDTKQKLKKSTFSKLQHNDSYLRSLPKTRYHLIFDLQTQLAERGHLKTHHDLEDFHRCIKYNEAPSQLERSLQDVRRKMLGKKPSDKPPCAGEARGHEGNLSHSGSLPNKLQSLKQGSGSGEISAAELNFSGSQKINDYEHMFPKMKVPTFATLQPNFMKNFQSEMPDLVAPELPEKSRKAEVYMRRLRQMHHLCLVNMTFSQRLLDKDADALQCWRDERGVQESVGNTKQPHNMTQRNALCPYTPWQQVLPSIDCKQKQKSRAVHSRKGSPKQPRSVQSDRGSRPKQPIRATSTRQHHFEAVVLEPTTCGSETPDPLSIEDVCKQKHVVIIDSGVKLWRNYT